jgi:hypothetical protein
MMGKVGFVCVCLEPLIVTLKLNSYFLYVPSGLMFRTLHFSHIMYLCVWYDSSIKPQLFLQRVITIGL